MTGPPCPFYTTITKTQRTGLFFRSTSSFYISRIVSILNLCQTYSCTSDAIVIYLFLQRIAMIELYILASLALNVRRYRAEVDWCKHGDQNAITSK